MIVPLGPKFKHEVESDLNTIKRIVDTGIFETSSANNPLVSSAFSELMISLHDLLQKSKVAGVAVDLKNDLGNVPDVDDVTDLVSRFRHAVAHITSQNRHTRPNGPRVDFGRIYGQHLGYMIEGIQLSGEYTDDMCFLYGRMRIYLRRHIFASYDQARIKLVPLLGLDKGFLNGPFFSQE